MGVMPSVHEPADIEVRPRNVEFDLSKTPLHWIPGEPVASDALSALHIAVPEGERWFCRVFAEALPYVKDDKLTRDMRGFIGQEAVHADTHDRAVSEFLEEHGVNTGPFLRQVEFLFRRMLAPRTVGSARLRRNDLVERLWLIAAIEHYTAVLGDFALNSNWTAYDADPVMTDLMRWHGAEEMEHRSIAHDVATYFDDSYLHRCRAMLGVVVGLLVVALRGPYAILREDPDIEAEVN
jgi:uncharacterized protein